MPHSHSLAASALLAIVVCLVLACSGNKGNTTNSELPTAAVIDSPVTSQATATSTAPAAAPSGSPDSATEPEYRELFEALDTLATATSWSADFRDSSVPTGKGIIEYVAPDRYHLALGSTELIAIGPDVYVHSGTVWLKGSTSADTTFDHDNMVATLAAVKSAPITIGGRATISGITCQIYTFRDTVGATDDEACVSNGRLVRLIEDDGSTKTTFIFTAVDSPKIHIEAPF